MAFCVWLDLVTSLPPSVYVFIQDLIPECPPKTPSANEELEWLGWKTEAPEQQEECVCGGQAWSAAGTNQCVALRAEAERGVPMGRVNSAGVTCFGVPVASSRPQFSHSCSGASWSVALATQQLPDTPA